MSFSQSFMEILVWAALVWTLLGAVVLIGLLIKDAMKKDVW